MLKLLLSADVFMDKPALPLDRGIFGLMNLFQVSYTDIFVNIFRFAVFQSTSGRSLQTRWILICPIIISVSCGHEAWILFGAVRMWLVILNQETILVPLVRTVAITGAEGRGVHECGI